MDPGSTGSAGSAASPSPAPRPPVAPRRRLGRRRKLAFALLTLAGGVLLAEGALRLAGFPRGLIRSTSSLWATDDERALGPFRPGARATIAWPPELAYTVEVNALGLRGALPADGPLVLCVGDSTTFGANVGEQATYPALVAGHLAARGVAASALNAGCPRWTITDQNDFLVRALPALRPRWVVLLFCGNDLAELDKDPARERALEGRSRLDGVREALALPDAFLALALRARRAYLEAAGRWPQPLREDQGRTGDWARPYWARYGEHLARTGGLAREARATLLVAAFPGYLELDGPPCEVERTLPDLARAAGATYVDLYAPFRASPGGRFLLPHDAHASPSGNDLIAREVAAAVAAVTSGT